MRSGTIASTDSYAVVKNKTKQNKPQKPRYFSRTEIRSEIIMYTIKYKKKENEEVCMACCVNQSVYIPVRRGAFIHACIYMHRQPLEGQETGCL